MRPLEVNRVYVQLLVSRALDGRNYQRGDWVEVGKQTALRWVAEGSARVLSAQKLALDPDCGVVIRGVEDAVQSRLARVSLTAKTQPGSLDLPWPRTLLWNGGCKLRPELIPAGFGFLDVWEVACPLLSHSLTAGEVGIEDERRRTEALIGDLRVPLFDSNVVFARQCDSVRSLIQAWQEEKVQDEQHAFLRAVYRVKPLILALPATWIEGR